MAPRSQRSGTRFTLASGLVLVACAPGRTQLPLQPLAAPAPAPHSVSTPEPDVSREAKVHTRAQLTALGGSWTPLGDSRALVCGDHKRSCLCADVLDCQGPCVTYEAAVARFRRALAHPGEGRSVECQLAETGVCGAFRYFLFRGDVYRDEVMWFTAEGRLVGMRSTTDHDAYCEHAADVEVLGEVPDCERVERGDLICGGGPSPAPPIEDFRRLTRQHDPAAPRHIWFVQ